MEYPEERITAGSRYSYAEICQMLDLWEQVEARYNAALNAIPDYSMLSTELQNKITWLEPIICPMDGVWHRAGNPEMFPVAKWKKLVKQHERLTSQLLRLTSVSSQNSD